MGGPFCMPKLILRPEVNLPHGKTSRIVAVVQYRTMGEKAGFTLLVDDDQLYLGASLLRI